jgi:RimJ/RimL family protein N-acetyltransferase
MAHFEIVLDAANIVNAWVRDHGGGYAPVDECRAMGLLRDKELVGGLVAYWYNGKNCYINIALLPGVPFRRLLYAGLRYAFGQLALRRLTFIVSSANLPSIQLVTGLGSEREATLREAGSEGEDLHIYALFVENCLIWSRLHGNRRRQPTSGT